MGRGLGQNTSLIRWVSGRLRWEPQLIPTRRNHIHFYRYIVHKLHSAVRNNHDAKYATAQVSPPRHQEKCVDVVIWPIWVYVYDHCVHCVLSNSNITWIFWQHCCLFLRIAARYGLHNSLGLPPKLWFSKRVNSRRKHHTAMSIVVIIIFVYYRSCHTQLSHTYYGHNCNSDIHR